MQPRLFTVTLPYTCHRQSPPFQPRASPALLNMASPQPSSSQPSSPRPSPPQSSSPPPAQTARPPVEEINEGNRELEVDNSVCNHLALAYHTSTPSMPVSDKHDSPSTTMTTLHTRLPRKCAQHSGPPECSETSSDDNLDSSTGSTSLRESVIEYIYDHGRRYHSDSVGDKYFMPNDEVCMCPLWLKLFRS